MNVAQLNNEQLIDLAKQIIFETQRRDLMRIQLTAGDTAELARANKKSGFKRDSWCQLDADLILDADPSMLVIEPIMPMFV